MLEVLGVVVGVEGRLVPLVGEALGALAGFRRIEQHTTLPSTSPDPAEHHDGGYFAVIERAG